MLQKIVFLHLLQLAVAVNQLTDGDNKVDHVGMNQMQDVIGQLVQSVNNIKASVDDLNQFKTKMEKKYAERNNFITFTAVGIENKFYGNGETVQFENAVINEGGYYNEANGIFTCHVAGYYLISFSVHSTAEHQMVAAIILDDSQIVDVAASYNLNAGLQASATTVVNCKDEQTIYIRIIRDDCRTYGSFSSFTGTLLSIQ